MKYLLKNIKASKGKVLANIRVGDLSYHLNSFGKTSSISLNGHDIIDCGDSGKGYERLAHLIRDLVVNGVPMAKDKVVYTKIESEANISDTLIANLKRCGITPQKLVEQSMEIPKTAPLTVNLEEATTPDRFIKKLKEFAQALHDINETLRVCRDDVLSLSSGRLVNTMWGAKQTQQILVDVKENISENEDWEKAEFYVNMILKSISRLIHKLDSKMYDVCDEEKKVVNTVLIPNIIQGFEKVKSILSKVLIMLSNFVYIDEVFKKNTSYPANLFINADMFEDIKLDYTNLVLFALKIPRYEQEILYPLDMMSHSFLNKSEIRQ
jgi:hypothetical protein